MILDIWFFDNFTLIAEMIAKRWQILEIFLFVNDSLWRKLVSSLPIIFIDSPKVFTVAFFVADFKIHGSYGWDNFIFLLLFFVILH